MGDVNTGTRRRAVGTRDRVMSHLARAGEVRDESGRASTVLAEAVRYPGSSIAFAQLLSGMERSGLIEREIRGKRTYRIAPAGAGKQAPAARPQGGARQVRSGDPQGSGPTAPAGYGHRDLRADEAGDRDPALAANAAGDFDYDELARRLLIQVVRRLAASSAEDPASAAGERALALARQASARQASASQASASQASRPLEETVASLEQKLASVQSRQRTLAE